MLKDDVFIFILCSMYDVCRMYDVECRMYDVECITNEDHFQKYKK